MKPIPTTIRSLLTIASAFVLSFSAITSSQAKEDGCWAEFFQDSQYEGDHFRFDGPIKLSNLHDIQGQNWEKRISSLKVGPNAKVTVFENPNFKLTTKEMGKYPELLRSLGLTEKDALEDSELIFDANSTVHNLSDFNFHNKTKSLIIDCEK